VPGVLRVRFWPFGRSYHGRALHSPDGHRRAGSEEAMREACEQCVALGWTPRKGEEGADSAEGALAGSATGPVVQLPSWARDGRPAGGPWLAVRETA
jgi:hypothetical protein